VRALRANLLAAGAMCAIVACGTGAPARKATPPPRPAAAPSAFSGADLAAGRALAAGLFGRDPLVADSRLLRYVALVGRAVAGPELGSRLRFAVTRSDLPYATAFPGGIVVVSRGLIFEMDSEAALAVTLGREMCRSETGAAREFPRGALEASDRERETALDSCGARRASAAGYDSAAFLHLLEALQDRAASVREKSDLAARREELRKLEPARGGKLLSERFRRSAIM